jgi:hypothetical protein
MLATWQHREGTTLTARAYRRAGGVGYAVQSSAEAAYEQLTAAGRDAARHVLTRLTLITHDGQLARRRATRDELHTAAAPASDEVAAVLGAFAAHRLIVLHGENVEIGHDALLRGWSRLRGWLDSDHADRTSYSQLVDDATTWCAHEQDPSFLYRGVQLATIQHAVTRWDADPVRYPPLTTDAAQFLEASKRRARRTTQLVRAVAAVLVLLTFAATAGAVIATNQAGAAKREAANGRRQAAIANQQHAIALSRQLAAQSQIIDVVDPVAVRRLAAAAWRISPTDQARDSMIALLTRATRDIARAHRYRVRGGVQPRRKAAGHRRRNRLRTVLEHQHPAADQYPTHR